MIHCTNLSLTFPDRQVFEELNFDVKEGQHLCLSGGSGTGKSSVLKLLLGFLSADQGEIRVNNLLLSQKTIHHIRKEMAWMPQNVNLPVQNGGELIQLMNSSERQNIIGDLLQKLGLEGAMLKTDFSRISGGEKQRIIIAVLLSLNKPVLLMDEPTSSLDEKSIMKLISVVKEMKNKTIISASHNHIWMDNADKVVQL